MTDVEKLSMKLHLDRVKTLINPELLLQSLGFTISMNSQGEIRCPCKIHNGDGKTSFRFKKSNNTFSCFSHFCHETYGADVVALVRSVKKCSFLEAVEYLSNFVGVPYSPKEFTEEDYFNISSKKFISKMKQPSPKKVETESDFWLSEENLEGLVKNRSLYFFNRGISQETLDKFEVGGFCLDGVVRATIPIRDEDNKLVGMSSRVDELYQHPKDTPKYSLLRNFNKTEHLYGLNVVKETPVKKIFLLEGFTGVWRFYDAGVSSVCCMGISLSPKQRYLLSKYFDECIIVFDGDDAGYSGAYRVDKFLHGFIKSQIITLPVGVEPSNMSIESILNLYSIYIEG